MLRTNERLNSMSAAALMVVSLTACTTDSMVAPDPEPAPQPIVTTTKLQVDFNYVEAVKDCDGIEGDGDFHFRVRAMQSWGGSVTVHNRGHTLGDGGRTAALGRHTFTAAATTGQQVTIELTASERDKPLIGATYNDSRMNNATRTAVHAYRDGKWTSTGPRTITLGSGNCQVRLHYSVNQLQ